MAAAASKDHQLIRLLYRCVSEDDDMSNRCLLAARLALNTLPRSIDRSIDAPPHQTPTINPNTITGASSVWLNASTPAPRPDTPST